MLFASLGGSFTISDFGLKKKRKLNTRRALYLKKISSENWDN